jgi:regulator of sirC expression with transglutaminase-like and TPR domain
MTALTEAITCYPPIIEDVALAIADDAYPNLSRMRYHGLLADIAQPLFGPMRVTRDPEARLELMRAHLCDELGFKGNSDDYYDPRNSYLNDVLERRVGIPISLAVVWMAVGRRVGLSVEGIGFPGHFMVRVGGQSGRYIDVFNEGHTLDERQLIKLGERYTGRAGAAAAMHLVPVGAREMAERMLLNLREIFGGRGDHARAMLACDRLFDITADAMHRRDRGLHALELGAREAALRDFEAYLSAFPDAIDAERIRSLLMGAAGSSAPLN